MERRILITGAGSGIGLATALHLAGLGFSVVGLVPDDEEAGRLCDAAGERRVDVATVTADLADPSARAHAAEGLALYALVNNAGYLNAGLLRDVAIDDARRQLEVMALAPVDLALRAIPAMLDRGEGRIVNVTTAAVHTATPFSGWYQATKAVLRELTDSLRLELAGSGLDIVDVEPGAMDTRIWPRAGAELRRRRSVSATPGGYRRALFVADRLAPLAPDPAAVARAVGRALIAGGPPAHVRVGVQAPLARAVSELVPDRLWDRLSSVVSGTA